MYWYFTFGIGMVLFFFYISIILNGDLHKTYCEK